MGESIKQVGRRPDKTVVMPVYRPLLTADEFSQAANAAQGDTIVIVLVADTVELEVQEGQMIILGRSHPSNKIQPTLDLSKFGGADSGASRMHASIRRDKGQWLLEDLASSNGTWVNGERLAPFVAHRLMSVSQVMLANLEVTLVLPDNPSQELIV